MRLSTSARAMRALFLATAGALALHGCATTPAPLTADDLLVAPYADPNGAAFDVDAFFAAFPPWLVIQHDGASFDPALGAMAINDLRIALRAAPEAALRADTALIWNGDPAAAEAVFSGAASLTDMAPLFDRMTLAGLRSEGAQWESGTESAALSVDKVVIDGMAARSFALAPKPDAEEGVDLLRTAAAVMGSFAYDAAAYSNFSFRLSNSQGDNVEFMIAESFARGYDAGATAYQSLRGASMSIEGVADNPLVEVSGEEGKDAGEEHPYAKILNRPPQEAVNGIVRHPAAFLANAVGGGAMGYELDFSEASGVDLSGALAWLARWELPPVSETELIDLGVQTMFGYRQTMNGRLVYSIDRADVAASDFYWLVPSDQQIRYQGFMYDYAALLEEARDGMPPGFATEAAPQFDQIIKTMAALGLDRVTGDMDLLWRWDGANGDAAMSMGMDLIDFGALEIGAEALGPSLARWEALARQDVPVTDAMDEIALKGLRYGIRDNGMLDRIFAFIAEQQGAPDGGPALRESVVAMTRLSGAQAVAMTPRAPAYANAAADFLQFGGALTLLAAPASPVSLTMLQAAAQSAPQTLPDVLNITLTHTE